MAGTQNRASTGRYRQHDFSRLTAALAAIPDKSPAVKTGGAGDLSRSVPSAAQKGLSSSRGTTVPPGKDNLPKSRGDKPASSARSQTAGAKKPVEGKPRWQNANKRSNAPTQAATSGVSSSTDRVDFRAGGRKAEGGRADRTRGGTFATALSSSSGPAPPWGKNGGLSSSQKADKGAGVAATPPPPPPVVTSAVASTSTSKPSYQQVVKGASISGAGGSTTDRSPAAAAAAVLHRVEAQGSLQSVGALTAVHSAGTPAASHSVGAISASHNIRAPAASRVSERDEVLYTTGFVSDAVLDALLEPLAEFGWDKKARDFVIRLLLVGGRENGDQAVWRTNVVGCRCCARHNFAKVLFQYAFASR